MAKLVLLTGLPGIGKTTVATSLPPPAYERLHFGGLLREAVEGRTGTTLAHSTFREEHHRLVTSEVVHDATLRVRELVSRSAAQICVLDSHAVTPTPIGLRAIPDNLERIQLLRFDGIIHLTSRNCVQRIVENSGLNGRQKMDAMEVEVAEALQLSTCVLYASAHDCPLVVVRATGGAGRTVEAVNAAIRSILELPEQ